MPQRSGGRHRGRAAPESANNAVRQRCHDSTFDPWDPELADHCGADGRVHHQRPHAGAVPLPGRPDLVWAVIASFFLGNILLLDSGLPSVGLWARILYPPYPSSAPARCCSAPSAPTPAAERVRYRRHDRMRRRWLWHAQIDMPIEPLVLGLILGPFLEKSLQNLARNVGETPLFFMRLLRLALLALVAASSSPRRCACHRGNSARRHRLTRSRKREFNEEGGWEMLKSHDMPSPSRRIVLAAPTAAATRSRTFPPGRSS